MASRTSRLEEPVVGDIAAAGVAGAGQGLLIDKSSA
jgi:hypothetical protein